MARRILLLLKSPTVIVPFAMIVALGTILLWPRPSPEERFRTALVALQQGDHAVVANAIDDLRARDGFEPHVHLLQGGLLLRQNDYRSALDELARTRPEGTLREPALLLTGECLYRNGQLADAESLFRQLISEQPDHPEGHRWLAAIYYDLGAMDQARTHLTALSKLRPDDFTPHWLSGQVHLDFEEFAKSADAYREALNRNPPVKVEQEIRTNLARALLKLRDYQQGLTVLSDVENTPTVLALKAECHSNLGELPLAQELLQQALERAPDDRDVLMLQARLQGDAGDFEQAVDSLTKLLRTHPHDYEGRYQLALAHRQLGRMDDYEREAARMEADRSLYNRLTELSKQAIRMPNDATIRDELADVCRRLEKHDLAQMWHTAAEACRRRTATTQ